GRPRREQLERRLAVAGGDDALDEAARLRHLRRRRLVHLAVEGQHAAVGAKWITFVSLPERLFERGADGRAAGVVVLDDDASRLGELAHQAERAVEVEDVVERQLLAVQHLCGGDTGVLRRGIDVERGLLVRVLAVAQLLLPLPGADQRRGERRGGGARGEVVGDGPV